jgi:hypothetical protein
MKKTITFIGGLIVGIIIMFSWSKAFPQAQDQDMDSTINDATTTEAVSTEQGDVPTLNDEEDDTIINSAVTASNTNTIQVGAQQAGTPVRIASVQLDAGEAGGWVVVHEVQDGVIGNALGAIRKDSGLHTDVVVQLLRETVSGGTYAVVLYTDNGDRQFSLTSDTPLTDAEGTFDMSIFNIQ